MNIPLHTCARTHAGTLSLTHANMRARVLTLALAVVHVHVHMLESKAAAGDYFSLRVDLPFTVDMII